LGVGYLWVLPPHFKRVTEDLLLVSRAMGHRDVQTSERYIGNHFLEIRKASKKDFPKAIRLGQGGTLAI
jgi:hypothetical protein